MEIYGAGGAQGPQPIYPRLAAFGVDAAIEDYLALAREFSLHPVHLALAFVTSRPFVTSNIIGATNIEQLKLILDAPCQLSPDILQRIDAIHQIRGNPAP